MSLRVWLPLNGTLDNQGLDDIVVTNNGATVDNSGKIGKCYNFDGNNDYISFPYSFPSEDWSYSIWFYTTSTNTQTLGCCRNGVGFGFSIFLINSKIRIDGIIGNDNQQWTTTYTFPTNIWVNLIVTSKNGLIKYYINGEYQTNKTVTINNTKLGNVFTIGASQTNGNGLGNYFKGKINDVRIYNHALSPMEVKQISQGLILHYPLNNNGWGQENLGNFASVASNWIMENLSGSNYTDSSYGNVIKLVTSSTNQRMYNYVPASMWQSGKVYTVSFLAKADTNGRTCDMSRSIADFSSTFTLTTNWKRYNGKITSTATPNGGTLSFRIHQSGATVYITQIKVEEGELATPYCPYYNESLYTIMGLNSTTEYDCSGFCNNGTRTGIFSWTSDTPKYEVSTNFSTISQHVHLNYNTNGFKDSYSISLWLKYNSTQTNSAPEIFGIPAYACLYISGNLIYWNTNDGTNNPFKNNGSTLSITPYVNNWHHFVITGNGTNVILYIDGMEAGRAITYKHFGGNKIVLSDKDNTRNTYSFIGLVSDFRIYATALSAEDVKSLYQNSAYIDNQGNIYGAVYEEV